MADSQNFSYHTFQARTTRFEHPTPLQIRHFTSSTYDSLKKRERNKSSRREKKLLGQCLVRDHTRPGTIVEVRPCPEHLCIESNNSDTTGHVDLEVPIECDSTIQWQYSTDHIQAEENIRGTIALVAPISASLPVQIRRQDIIAPVPDSAALKFQSTFTRDLGIRDDIGPPPGVRQVSESDNALATQENVGVMTSDQDLPQIREALPLDLDAEYPADLLCDLPSHRMPCPKPEQTWTCTDEDDLVHLCEMARRDWESAQAYFPRSIPDAVGEKHMSIKTNAFSQRNEDVSTDVGHFNCERTPEESTRKTPTRKISNNIHKRNKATRVKESQKEVLQPRQAKLRSKVVSKATIFAQETVRTSRSGRPIRHPFQNRPDEGYFR